MQASSPEGSEGTPGTPEGGTRPDRPPVRPAAQGPLGVQDTGPVRGARWLSEGGGWPRLTRPGVLHTTQLSWMRRGERCRVARPGIAHRDVRATESGRTLKMIPHAKVCIYTPSDYLLGGRGPIRMWLDQALIRLCQNRLRRGQARVKAIQRAQYRSQ